MSGVFVHGLWGEAEGSECPTRGHSRTLEEVQRFLDAPSADGLPAVTYAWGAENYDALRALGFLPILASRDPIVNYSTDGRPRDPRDGNQINWGDIPLAAETRVHEAGDGGWARCHRLARLGREADERVAI